MSIKAYVGRMGSGKTYEVVTSVILPALARGRRVISNIAGLDYEDFCAVLVEDGVPFDKIGKLVQVSHDDVLRSEFWLTDKDSISDRVHGFLDKITGEPVHCVQPGDLVALDENWRFWEGYSDRKMPDRVMNFFRMHRHFTHPETGISCDVALISQDVMDFSRKVRAVIEETYYMQKHTAVGSTKRYRVDVHQGGKITRSPLRQLQRFYDPRYFPLYSSHSLKQAGSADAKEENIDKRGNILSGAIFKIGLPVAAIVFVIASFGLWRFFHPKEAEQQPEMAVQAPNGQPVTLDHNPPEINASWRVIGWWMRDASMVVALQDASGVLRLIADPRTVKITSLGLELELPEGGFATSWTAFGRADSVLP